MARTDGRALSRLDDFGVPQSAAAVEDLDLGAGPQPAARAPVLGFVVRQRHARRGGIKVRHVETRAHAESILIRTDVLSRTNGREVPHPLSSGKRRLWQRLSRGRHLDRQEGRHQGSASPEPRLRRAAPRTAPARHPQPSQHRHRPHRREAGRRVLHRDGVRAGRHAGGGDRSRRHARPAARARLHLPDLQRDGPRAQARDHPSRPAARATCWSPIRA